MTPSNRKLDVNVVQSNYHIELTPSDVGMYDRVVIQDILKEIAQTQQVDLNAKQKFKGESRSLPKASEEARSELNSHSDFLHVLAEWHRSGFAFASLTRSRRHQ